MCGDEIICIDHHPVNDKFQYRFCDIRPKVGACASIIAQYFFENNIPMDRRIATALTFGIRVDTRNLSRGVSELDMEMLYRMFHLCDSSVIQLLENNSLYFEDLMAYSRAISSIEVYGNISFADAGQDCPEALIASVSDFMVAVVEMNFSVVYSLKKDGIKLSVRSEGVTLDAGKIIAKALDGIGSGGGHASMAGGFIPFSGTQQEAAILMGGVKERFIECITQKSWEKGV
jgi:nanoRNase/pAp phosphatase (c-di-AMP/oligoRNAs hydrolase)